MEQLATVVTLTEQVQLAALTAHTDWDQIPDDVAAWFDRPAAS